MPINKTKKTDLFIALVLFLIAAIVISFFKREPLSSDDLSMMGYANGMIKGPLTHNSLRMGLVFPTHLSISLFNYSILSYHMVSIGFSSLLVSTLYLFSRFFFSPLISFFAAIFLLINPLFLREASLLLPDWPSLSYFMIGLTIFTYSLTKKDITAIFLIIFSGIFIYLAIWTKESNVFLLPTILLIVFSLIGINKRAFKILLLLFGVGLTMLTVELFLLYNLTGDPLLRFRSILGGHVAKAATLWKTQGLINDINNYGDLITRFPKLVWKHLYGDLFLIFSGLSIAFIPLLKSRKLYVLLAGTSVIFLLLSLSIVSTDPLTPLLRTKIRYFSIVLLPLSILVPATLFILFNNIGSIIPSRYKSLSWLLPSIIIISIVTYSGTLCTKQARWFQKNSYSKIHATYLNFVNNYDKPIARIVTDWRTQRALLLYLSQNDHAKYANIDFHNWETNQDEFTIKSAKEFNPGDLVILNKRRLRLNRRYHSDIAPDYLISPPDNWLLISKNSNIIIYYVIENNMINTDIISTHPEEYSLFHAYSFEKKGSIKPGSTYNSFYLNKVSDARITLGTGKYHHPPAEQFAQFPQGNFWINVNLSITTIKNASISYAKLVLFSKNHKKPTIIRMDSAGVENNMRKFSSTFPILSGSKYYSYRVLIKAKGSGDISINDLNVSIKQIPEQYVRLISSMP